MLQQILTSPWFVKRRQSEFEGYCSPARINDLAMLQRRNEAETADSALLSIRNSFQFAVSHVFNFLWSVLFSAMSARISSEVRSAALHKMTFNVWRASND